MPSEAEIKAAAPFHCLERFTSGSKPCSVICEYCERSAKDALEAAERARWQPIETAPKDGTPILVIRAGDDDPMEIAEWCVREHAHFEERPDGLYERVQDPPSEFWNGNAHRATHWQPLPSHPESK
jgi:hypothetical protein